MTKFDQIKGFAFDLDGVITDTAKFHEQAWSQLAASLDIPWNQQLADKLKGISRMDSLEMILQAGHKENDYTPDQKEQLAEEKNEHYKQLIKTITPEDILPGMKEFITSLTMNGYKASIASASKNAPTILEQLNIADQFVGIVDPSTLSNGKPDPEIFIKAGEILQLQPEEIIGLEDAPAGISSIKGAGQTALGIGEATKSEHPDLYFETTELISLESIKEQMN